MQGGYGIYPIFDTDLQIVMRTSLSVSYAYISFCDVHLTRILQRPFARCIDAKYQLQ